MIKTFTIDEVEFVLDTRPGRERGVSTDNRFVLVKNDTCMNFYTNWVGEKPKTIMDVGLFEGGSIVLFDKLFRPERIVGLDLRRNPIQPLDKYASENPHMKIYYGHSQDKPETLAAARQNFPNGIDLVVDDASHLYEQTKATFQMLFPMVSPGGVYVIEDWAWSFTAPQQRADAPWAQKDAMANLIFEIVAMSAIYGVIESVKIDSAMVAIRKSTGKLPDAPFDLTPHLRGRQMTRI